MSKRKADDRTTAQVAESEGVQLMMRQGAQWTTAGQFYQAIDLYSKLMQEYPESSAAREAQTRLLKIARAFRDAGKYHQALALYYRVSEFEATAETQVITPSAPSQAG